MRLVKLRHPPPTETMQHQPRRRRCHRASLPERGDTELLAGHPQKMSPSVGICFSPSGSEITFVFYFSSATFLWNWLQLDAYGEGGRSTEDRWVEYESAFCNIAFKYRIFLCNVAEEFSFVRIFSVRTCYPEMEQAWPFALRKMK